MLSLAFDRRDFVLLDDNTYRWIDVKHFTFQPASGVDAGDVIDSLINNWRYRDHYASATSHEEDAQTIHGPFLVATISRDNFTPIDAHTFCGVIHEFLSLHDNFPATEKQAEIDGALRPLQSHDTKFYQMNKSLDDDIHEWGFVLWEFRELLAIELSKGQLALCVMAID